MEESIVRKCYLFQIASHDLLPRLGESYVTRFRPKDYDHQTFGGESHWRATSSQNVF